MRGRGVKQGSRSIQAGAAPATVGETRVAYATVLRHGKARPAGRMAWLTSPETGLSRFHGIAAGFAGGQGL